MEHVEELLKPEGLRDPVLFSGFMMRRRAGRLAARTIGYLVEHWHAEPLARIDMSPFLNLVIYRPEVSWQGDERIITWPEATIYIARDAIPNRDAILLPSFEPQYRWRTFVDEVAGYLDGLGVRTYVSLRASAGEVPHTRPAPVYVTASDIELELEFGVQTSRPKNEGPSSIAGVLAAKVESLRWRTAELAVQQPDYFPRMPNAAAMLSFIRVIDKAFGTSTPTDSLRKVAQEQYDMLEVETASDPATRSAIEERERAYDLGLERLEFLAPAEESELPSGNEILEEVERLFRGVDSED